MSKRFLWLITVLASLALMMACRPATPPPEAGEINETVPVSEATSAQDAAVEEAVAPDAGVQEEALTAAEQPPAEEQATGEMTQEQPAPEAAESGGPEMQQAARTYGLVAGPIDDRGFNQLAWEGLQRAAQELGIEVQYAPTQDGVDYTATINQLLTDNADAVVAVGFDLASAIRQASQANPSIPFIGVDFPSQTPTDLGLLFASDEPSFLAGYLAAGMSQTGVVCTYGGRPLPPVLIFMVGFEQGVNYYNAQNNAGIQVLGWRTDANIDIGGEGEFLNTFSDQTLGRQAAERFFDQGCDVIMPVAGAAGLGAAAAAQERGLKVIGVDADQTQTAPEYANVYLTSVLKKIDAAVFEAVRLVESGEFGLGGGFRSNYIGTLANEGVGLAPFYGYEDQIPLPLKDNLAQTRELLIQGALSTGWPVSRTQPETTTDIAASGPAPASDGRLTPEILQNATYQSDWTDSGLAPMVNGLYTESIVPGAATQIEVRTTDFMAFGDLNGDSVADAAIVLVTSPGGSGAFLDLAAVINRNGLPVNLATFPLGDRVQINSITIENGEIVVDMITHGPNDPMCCPTQAVTKRFGLQNLVERSAEAAPPPPASAPDPTGVYTTRLRAASSPGIDVTLELRGDNSVVMTSDYLNGEAPIVETGIWNSDGDTVFVQLTSLNGRPVDEQITFELQGDMLVAVDYDQTVYGATGLQLSRQ